MKDKIELVKDEIFSQTNELPKLYEELKNSSYNKILKGVNVILTGCGDSYAASLMLNEIVNVRVIDPYEAYFQNFDKETIFVIISVSGKTVANLNLAKKLKENGNKIIAVTGRKDSPLAKIANDIVWINYEEKIILPGTLSFTKTLVALYNLFGIEVNFNSINEELIKRAFEETREISGDLFYVLGGTKLYPACYYFKAKILEFSGHKTIIERIEQFAHTDLFGLSFNDTVIFLSRNDRKVEETFKLLADKVKIAKCFNFNYNIPETYLISSIYAQALGLNLLIYNGLNDFYFAKSKLLKISDQLIY
jgi:D-arabinose 5-phosphate isomerase GutQ